MLKFYFSINLIITTSYFQSELRLLINNLVPNKYRTIIVDDARTRYNKKFKTRLNVFLVVAIS